MKHSMYRHPKMSDRRGFTLIEILVSVTIISFIVLVIIQAFIATVRANTKSEALRDIKQNGDFAMNTMVRMIQNAQSINTSDADSTSLVITNPNGNTTTFQSTSTPPCRVASNSSNLTSANVNVVGCSMSFTIDTLYGKPASVTIEFSLEQSKTTTGFFERASTDFKTTTNVRNVDL